MTRHHAEQLVVLVCVAIVLVAIVLVGGRLYGR